MNNPFIQTHVLPLGSGLRDSGRKVNFIAADTAKFLVLANSEVIQNQRMHKQICRYVIKLYSVLE